MTQSQSPHINPVRQALVAKAVEDWIGQSWDPTGRNRLLYYRNLKVGTLSFEKAQSLTLNKLLTGTKVQLKELFPQSEDLFDAARRCRAILSRAQQSQQERGIETLKLAHGMATWKVEEGKSEPNAPVLLCSIKLTERGRFSDNYDLELSQDWELNPSLVYALNQMGTQIDNAFLEQKFEAMHEGRHDFNGIITTVNKSAKDVQNFTISLKSVLGNFSYLKLAQAQKLKESQDEICNHTLLSAIAGDETARSDLREGVLDLSGESLDDEPPADEFLVLDADGSQRYAINAAIRGQNMVLIGPPGTGKSQTISNMIAALTARGKKTLFVAEKRAAIEAVIKRLDSSGLGHLILDMHDGSTARRRVAQDIGDALNTVSKTPEMDTTNLHRNLSTNRNKLNRYEEALHKIREPWEMSLFEAQSNLLAIPEKCCTEYQFSSSATQNLSKDQHQRINDLLSDFSDLKGLALERGHKQVWAGAYQQRTMQTADQVREASKTITTLLDLVQRISNATQEVSETKGDISKNTVEYALELVGAITALDDIYKTFTPRIYESNLEDLLEELNPAKSNVLVQLFSRLTNKRYREARVNARQMMSSNDSAVASAPANDSEIYIYVEHAVRIKKSWMGKPPAKNDLSDTGFKVLVENTANCASLLNYLEKFAIQTDLKLYEFKQLFTLLESLDSDRETMYQLPQISDIRDQLDQLRISDFLSFCCTTEILDADLPQSFNHAWLSSIVELITIDDRRISGFSLKSQQKTVDQFQSIDRHHIQIASDRVKRKWAEKVVAVRDNKPDESAIVSKQAALRSRHMATSELIKVAGSVVGTIKPCWVMSPLVVAEKLPSGQNFDVVIFDEASQILPADAVLSLLQANQAIVAGDPKQLPPTTFFTSVEEELEEEAHEEEIEDDNEEVKRIDDEIKAGREFALTSDLESVLDVMTSVLPAPHGTRTLSWHYRSEDERLIAFSNAQTYLYNWQLTTFPGATGVDCISHESALHSHDTVEPAKNDSGPLSSSSHEVQHVVDLIVKHAEEYPNRSLGVIGFGITHANRIQETLRQFLRDRPDLDAFFNEDKEEAFFIKNLERVQGDERDSIIISVGYSKLPDGRMRYVFGPLNRLGGERRLNVAISRAKKTCKIVSSFEANDMDPNRLRVDGTRMLKAYLEYADSGGNDLGMAAQVKPSLNPFERDVQDAMAKSGINNVAQYGSSGYWIDFAAMHPERQGEPVLAIETDGASYHSSYSARDRDRLRQEQLERQGWEFHRIWSTSWFRDKEKEIVRLEEAYQRAVNKRDGGPEEDRSDDPPPEPPEPTSDLKVIGIREGKVPDAGRASINDYSEREIRNLLSWIESDGLLRTKPEVIEEAFQFLGFTRRTPKFKERLENSVNDHRAGKPVRRRSTKRAKKVASSKSLNQKKKRTKTSSSYNKSNRWFKGNRYLKVRESIDATPQDSASIRSSLNTAIRENRKVSIYYANASNKRSVREVSIRSYAGNYLKGTDGLTGEDRTFSVSRIKRVMVLHKSSYA